MRIKVVTLNMWYGGRLMEQLLSFLKDQDSDILMLQEVYDGHDTSYEPRLRTMEVLRKELGYTHDAFFPSYIDTQEIGNIDQGNAIFSKNPIVASNSTFFDVPYGPFDDAKATDWQYEPMNMVHAALDINGCIINAYSVHGIWAMHGKDSDRRIAMANTIVEQIRGKENVILAGDFNVRPKTRTIEIIEDHVVNIFKDELETSFNMKRKSDEGYANAVVDFIFISKNIQVMDHTCLQVDVSDHLPLVAVLEI